ncbi:HIT-like domain-containing protein [Melanogaster broomeanus]|nr:HIT-like domain-containing protein [Melanogaster broomeanus]
MHPIASTDSNFHYDLKDFIFGRILDENPNFHSLIVLGTFPAPSSLQSSESPPARDVLATAESESVADARLPAILRIERTAFPPSFTDGLSSGVVASTRLIGNTDIINVIFPATEVHIRKYTRQELLMVTETPEMYERIVKAVYRSVPGVHARSVPNPNGVLHRTSDFLILPDMKWDPSGPISSLYLLALVHDPTIRSLRDLRGGGHVRMLEEIRRVRIRSSRSGGDWGGECLRMYVHYQPSYYHFHVHIVHASQAGMMGMDHDIISMLKLSPTILSDLTFTYGLGSQHGLYDAMTTAQAELTR